MFQLTVRGPDGSEKLYFLGADQGLLIGRDETCDICLPSDQISRRHARFFTTGRSLQVQDLGSQSGVSVGGSRISAETEVRPGIAVEIGEYSIRVKREQAINASDYAGTLSGFGAMQGRTLTLPSDKATVGREQPAEIVVVDDSVSRRHADIRRLPDGSYIVRDLNSSNGTQINNARIPPESDRPLRPGDKVAFGETNWVVTSAHGATATGGDAQKSRSRVVLLLVGVSVVVLLAMLVTYATLQNRVTTGPEQHHEVSAHDLCLGDVENERFDKAATSCQGAWEEDPIDSEIRMALRKVGKEAKYKEIYDQGTQRENSSELQALDVFFGIDPSSTYFPKAKIEVDRILERQRGLLCATCKEAAKESSKKKGNSAAVDPCTRCLNYTCHVKGVDDAILKLLKNADTKEAADWKCPPALAPWFVVGGSAAKAETECPKKYSSDKDIADACVLYANNSYSEAEAKLDHATDSKAEAAAFRDQIEAMRNKLQTAHGATILNDRKTAYDAMLAIDAKLMPANIESAAATEARDRLAADFTAAGNDDLSKNNNESAYKHCATAATYRLTYQGLSNCLEQSARQLEGQLPQKSCDELKSLFDVARPDFRDKIKKVATDKSCQ